jgi:ribosomal protein S18 acetylase RimI-like enzyme
MTLRLRPMTAEELAAWIDDSEATYAEDRRRAGEPDDVARRTATEQYAGYFPDRRPAPGQHVFVIADDGERVGIIWVGPHPRRPDEPDVAWLYDIEVDDAYRGHGHARGALELVEAQLALGGVRELGLNVFGDNDVARRLYGRAGYREVAVTMTKQLVTG